MIEFYTQDLAAFAWVTVENFCSGDLLAMQDFQPPHLWGALEIQEVWLSSIPDRIELRYELPDDVKLTSNAHVQITADWQENRRVVRVIQIAHWGDRLLGRQGQERKPVTDQCGSATEHIPFYTWPSLSRLVRSKDLQPGDVLAIRDEKTGRDGFVPIQSIIPLDDGAMLLEYRLPDGARMTSSEQLRITVDWENNQRSIFVTQVVEANEYFLDGMKASCYEKHKNKK